MFYTQIIKNKQLVGVIQSKTNTIVKDFIHGKDLEFSKLEDKYLSKVKKEFKIKSLSLNTKK
jgi:hypothetical protein